MQITSALYKVPSAKIINQYPEVIDELNKFCEKYDISGTNNLKQKLYHYLNNLTQFPLCSHCNKNRTSFENSTKGYRKYCSCKCKSNSTDSKQNTINTNLRRHGCENISQNAATKLKKENTFQEKYGNKNPLKIFEKKIKETWFKKYGGNPSYSKEVKNKISDSNKKANKERGADILSKRIDTLYKRKGVTSAFHLCKNKKESIPEKKLRKILAGEKIIICHKEFDIYLEKENILIEVDGEYFHPSFLKNIKFHECLHAVNDIEKELLIKKTKYKLYRIRASVIESSIKKNEKIDLDFVKKNSYTPDRNYNLISDVVSREEIEKRYFFDTKKDFVRKIASLKRLLKLTKGTEIIDTKSFLKKHYDLELKSKILIVDEIKRNLILPVKYNHILCKKEIFKQTDINILKSQLDSIFYFIRENIPDFIYPEPTETLKSIFERIGDMPVEKVLDVKNKTFKNNVSVLANNYLKSIFHSYFHSKYSGKTPYELYYDDDALKKIIAWRIGINDSNEYYDLSFKNIIKGMSAIRKTISFFKPSVAAAIYKHFLGDNDVPCAFDACCGFGGRMLGFYIKYPKGKYIGCEPNKETFAELRTLEEKINEFLGYKIDCVLYNMKFEEFMDTEFSSYQDKINLSFTSIPYYNKEKYSVDVISTYKSFDDWKNKFIEPFRRLPNSYINMPQELFDRLKLEASDIYFLNFPTARHLDKSKNTKSELIVKLK